MLQLVIDATGTGEERDDDSVWEPRSPLHWKDPRSLILQVI